MAAIPTLMAYDEWLQKTNRKKWHGRSDKDRSTPLQAIDQLVDDYEKQPQPTKLENLKALLENWMRSKTDKHGTLKTIREHQHAVTDLKRALDNAIRLLPPLEWDNRYPGIYIAQDVYRGNAWVPDDFPGTVNTSLDTIEGKPIGKALLKSISDACVRTTKKVIIEYSATYSSAAPLDDPSDSSRKKVQGPGDRHNPQELLSNPKLVAKQVGMVDDKRKDFVGGGGSSAVITWKHTDKGLDDRPTFIALAHELVHAYHYVNGLCYRAASGGISDLGNSGIMEEEMRTVGILKYKGEVPSENAIRKEHRVNLRDSYAPNVRFDNVTATAFV